MNFLVADLLKSKLKVSGVVAAVPPVSTYTEKKLALQDKHC